MEVVLRASAMIDAFIASVSKNRGTQRVQVQTGLVRLVTNELVQLNQFRTLPTPRTLRIIQTQNLQRWGSWR